MSTDSLGFSVIDLRKINKMYKCSSRKVKPVESTTMETPPRIVDPQPEIAPKESTGTEIIDHKITQVKLRSLNHNNTAVLEIRDDLKLAFDLRK